MRRFWKCEGFPAMPCLIRTCIKQKRISFAFYRLLYHVTKKHRRLRNMMEKQTPTAVPLWAIPAMDSFISTVTKKNDAVLFRQNIRRLASALDEDGANGWTEITPRQIWIFFRGRPFWQFRGVARFLNFIGLESLVPLANERNVKRILET